jgi:magnesium transporter
MASKRRREPGSPSKHAEPSPKPLWALAWSEAAGVRTLSSVAEFKAAYADPASYIWIDLQDPSHDLLASVSKILGLHPLIVEDILERNQRAKVELTDDTLHVVIFSLTYEGEVVAHELDMVLGQRFLLTSHDADIDLQDAPFMRRNPSGHLADGPDYCLWLIADWLVDGYFPVFDRIGEEIEGLEIDVINKPNKWVVERIFAVRRDLLQIRHAVNPQREIFNQVTNRDLTLIKPERLPYFRDVYDHLIRLTDELDSYRELVSTTLDIYVSQINNNLSEIMKRLTAVTVVLAGIAAIGGIFGMSEAGSAFNLQEGAGFWIITAFTLGLGGLALLYFRRIGWI